MHKTAINSFNIFYKLGKMSFLGKVAIVTGGTLGIGNAYASALLNIGMKVCICDIKDDTIDEFIENLPEDHKNNFIFQKCDVSSFSDFKGAFDKVILHFGRVDVLVNNAGIANESDWMKILQVNFIGAVHGIQLAFQYMDINKGGHGGFVVNTGSCTGFEAFELAPVYSASKFGVHGLTKSYGTEYHYKRSGVRVSAVCPGAVDTSMHRSFFRDSIDEEEAIRGRDIWKPIKTEEVAKALILLLQEGKNGALLRVDEKGIRYA